MIHHDMIKLHKQALNWVMGFLDVFHEIFRLTIVHQSVFRVDSGMGLMTIKHVPICTM